ncbi:MAG: tRNA pseudouridine(55) synthase TruB [Thermodesulfobacteriota bacterium]
MTEGGFEAGIFLIDKPAGVTSFSVVAMVRRLLGIKKVGHAGTLDPFATGLLIVCAGRPATRMISRFMDSDKEYEATLQLGVETETLDPEGKITSKREVPSTTAEEVERVLDRFRGEQLQVPPAYSALKHKGKPLYHYARKGIKVVKEPRTVHIYELVRLGENEEIGPDRDQLEIRVRCSKGTYIRTLGADIGRELGCGAYLTALRRTRSGCFSVENSVDGAQLSGDEGKKHLLDGLLSIEDVSNLLQ